MKVKIQQIVFGILAIASIFASSVSACSCSHHQERTEVEPASCHEHSQPSNAKKNGAVESANPKISETGCGCFQFAPKMVAKSETVQIEKHPSVFAFEKPLDILTVSETAEANFYFTKPLYLSDSFYNLSPGRAPPVL